MPRAGSAVGELQAPPGGSRPAVVLRSLALRPGDDGHALLLELTGAAEADVTAVHDEGRRLVRLYVDLPPGSRAVSGLGRRLAAGSIAGARVGQGAAGGVRVVVDVHRARGWRLQREAGGLTLALTVTPGGGDPGRPPRAAAVSSVRPPPPPPAGAPPDPVPAAAGVPPASVPADPPPTGLPVATSPSPEPARPKIVLDPGHGGDDPGAIGFAVEKEVTLDVASQVAALLRERLGAAVVLTRTDDRTLPLAARTARANAENADLFVSIHANANPGGTLQGVETYVLDDSDDHAVLRLASMENGLDMLGPGREQTDLRYILSDLVQGGKMDDSVALAAAIQRDLVLELRGRHADVVDLGVKRGPFYVLVGAYMPCVLVEASFVTHPVEGRRLAGAAYRTAVADGIYAGIARFLRDGARARTL